MLTPAAANGIAKCSTSPSQLTLVTSTSPTSHPLAGALRALTRYPPSTRTACPLESTQSEAPVLIRIAPPATFENTADASTPWLCRHTCAATRCECIAKDTAVDGSRLPSPPQTSPTHRQTPASGTNV